MPVTNKYGLPKALFEAMTRDTYRRDGKYSASQLPSPPQILVLRERYADQIEEDVSDFLWILQGQSIHHYLAAGETSNAIKEEQLTGEAPGCGGILVSGTTDIYDGCVEDYKVTSVWSFLIGGLKPEWEAQLNVYAWLWRTNGFKVEGIRIRAILRDWQKSKVGQDYPPIPFQSITVPDWGLERQVAYVEERVRLHEAAKALPDADLPDCTPDEQWARPDAWALMKKGRKTATRVLPSLGEAEALLAAMKDAKDYSIQHRPGSKARCEGYCNVSPFCCQYRREHLG